MWTQTSKLTNKSELISSSQAILVVASFAAVFNHPLRCLAMSSVPANASRTCTSLCIENPKSVTDMLKERDGIAKISLCRLPPPSGVYRGFEKNTKKVFTILGSEKAGAGAGAVEKAVAQSGVVREDVNYINAQATSTLSGDVSEYEAITRCFGYNSEVSWFINLRKLKK
ncbi:hypothetical protein L1887_14767 [Cichorium endivia]|nr:hypothetical protein L1887_14767 [Cichorium endivia]